MGETSWPTISIIEGVETFGKGSGIGLGALKVSHLVLGIFVSHGAELLEETAKLVALD
ncbi:MAG: hypothetical protein KGY80_09845 [Candidatus Thorarchaeota archaeon]|nr:hypothetical protein [Candidatus Thorarchaeota archaeon]